MRNMIHFLKATRSVANRNPVAVTLVTLRDLSCSIKKYLTLSILRGETIIIDDELPETGPMIHTIQGCTLLQ